MDNFLVILGGLTWVVFCSFIGYLVALSQFKKRRRVATRVLLNAQDFYELVGGNEVKKQGVSFYLEDIGYDVMLRIVQDRQRDFISKLGEPVE